MIPRLMRQFMHTFMGIEGTRIPTLLRSGELVYFSAVMRHGQVAPACGTVAPIAAKVLGQAHRKAPAPPLY